MINLAKLLRDQMTSSAEIVAKLERVVPHQVLMLCLGSSRVQMQTDLFNNPCNTDLESESGGCGYIVVWVRQTRTWQ